MLDSMLLHGHPLNIDAARREDIIKGPSEKDIVYSGLEETMIVACRETLRTSLELGCSYRIAAYVNALRKISVCYDESGFLLA
jgi:glutamate dehydrogenase (NAD(P)+)